MGGMESKFFHIKDKVKVIISIVLSMKTLQKGVVGGKGCHRMD